MDNYVQMYFVVKYTSEGQFFETRVSDLTHGVILANEIKNRHPHTQPTIHNHIIHETYNERYEIHMVYSFRGYLVTTLEKVTLTWLIYGQ